MGVSRIDARLGPTRRRAGALIAGAVLAGASRPAGAEAAQPARKDVSMSVQARFAYVSCRTTRERNARGDGIGVYRLPPAGGAWDRIQLVEGLLNPSFLAFDHDRRRLYTVHGDSSEVSAFAVDPQHGTLAFLNRVSCRGKNPVHLVVDPSGRTLIVANHVAGGGYEPSLATLPIGPDGALGEVVDLVPLTGKLGPHRVEQPFAKPHQVVFDPVGRFLAVPDKGLDLISTYRLDQAGKLHATDAPPARAREGAGPRHLVFHPSRPFVFVLNELSSTVMVCGYAPETGAITPCQEVSSLPDTFIGFSRASEIAISPDGMFVYASNRGHDSVAAFAVDAGTGRLSPVGWTSAEGRTPRFFALDPLGKNLFVANEDSDTIIDFTRDGDRGGLVKNSVVAETGSPTCILFA